jgi:hypothetical protein
MSRGLFVFVIQMFVCLGVSAIGVWPSVKDTVQLTAVVLRLLGAFALWYGYVLFSGFRQELLSLGFGWLFGRFPHS